MIERRPEHPRGAPITYSETLLEVSEQFPGLIMAWSQFEEKVIRDMSELFPDLAERLAGCGKSRSVVLPAQFVAFCPFVTG